MTALESRELNSQHERELRCSEGSGMLIGDPLSWGSNASSTNEESDLITELWGAKNSFLRMRGELRHSEGSGMIIGGPSKVRGAMLTLPTRLRREPHAHRWPSNVRGAMLALPTRRAIKQEGTKRPKNLRLLNDSFGEQRTQLSAWEGTQMLRREWHAHRWPSQLREAMLARPSRRATYHRGLGKEN